MKNGRAAVRAWLPAILMLSSLWLSACGSGSDSTTSPTAVVTLAADTFNGSIQQNGTGVHSFTVTSSGYTLLAGYTSISPSMVPALGLGIGSWDSSTSSSSLNVSQTDTARSGNTGLSGTPNSGAHCVRVYDGGSIPAGVTVSYTLQVQHY